MGPHGAVGPGKNSQLSHPVSGPDYVHIIELKSRYLYLFQRFYFLLLQLHKLHKFSFFLKVYLMRFCVRFALSSLESYFIARSR